MNEAPWALAIASPHTQLIGIARTFLPSFTHTTNQPEPELGLATPFGPIHIPSPKIHSTNGIVCRNHLRGGPIHAVMATRFQVISHPDTRMVIKLNARRKRS